tara:strand:- start:356 stop:637 length:282 start_codon:yes stop_codon:yes gene_type:complete
MIKSIAHKGLRQFAMTGNPAKLPVQGAAQNRVGRLLRALDAAGVPEDMNLPGFYFHELGGGRKGTFSIRVTGNWRLTFRWDAGAIELDLEDYH